MIFPLVLTGISTILTQPTAKEEINDLWRRFFSEHIPYRIPDVIRNEIYALYTDYEDPPTGNCTFFIGLPVAGSAMPLQGTYSRKFKEQSFIKYTAQGKMPEAIYAIWQKIYFTDYTIGRTYDYDMEVYDLASFETENPKVDLYISTKKKCTPPEA